MVQDPLTLYKLIILYMLDRVNFKMTRSQLSGFILEKEYTNFMTLQQVFSDLQDAELIKADTLMNRTYFSITEEGRKTLSYFGNRISDTIKKDIDDFLAEKKVELKNESSVTAAYYKATNGEYEVSLVARERDRELVNIRLAVADEEIAVAVCENWYKKNGGIYKYLVGELF